MTLLARTLAARGYVTMVGKKEIICEDTLQFGVMLDEFSKATTGNRPFKCSGEMGLRDIRIIKAIYASA